MNSGIKALIKIAIDAFGVGKSVFSKADFVIAVLPKLYAVAMDVPGVVSGIPDLGAELVALKAAEADADLIAYIVANVAGVTSDEHAKAVLASVLIAVEHVVQDVIAVKAAIEAPAA